MLNQMDYSDKTELKCQEWTSKKIKVTHGGKHNKENSRRELEWIYKNKTETAVLVRRPIVRYAFMPMGGCTPLQIEGI